MPKKDFIHEFFKEVWIDRNTSYIEKRCSKEIISHYMHNKEKSVGIENKLLFVANWFKAFPSVNIMKIEEVGSRDDFFYIKWKSRVKHEGLFLDLSPTKKTIDIQGNSFYKIENNLIVENISVSDTYYQLINHGSFFSRNKHQNLDLYSKIAELSKGTFNNRDIEVLSLWFSGHSIKESASILVLSPKTIEEYRGRIKDKLNLRNRKDLYNFFVANKLADSIFLFSKQLILN